MSSTTRTRPFKLRVQCEHVPHTCLESDLSPEAFDLGLHAGTTELGIGPHRHSSTDGCRRPSFARVESRISMMFGTKIISILSTSALAAVLKA